MNYTKLSKMAAALVIASMISISSVYADTSTSTASSTNTGASSSTSNTSSTSSTNTTNNTTIIYVPYSTMTGINNILIGRDLKVGSRGDDVAFLQGLLIELGYLNVPYGIPLGYFGPLTKSAVARYQSSQGVISTGYFGPLTKAAMRNQFQVKGWLQMLFPG